MNKKKEAVKRMKTIGLLPKVITEFEHGTLNLSEAGMLYFLDDEQKKMVEEFEKEYKALVYHVCHECTNVGEMYDLLYVSDHEEEWSMDNEDLEAGHPFVYVVNKTYPEFSEFGMIGIRPVLGGIVRVN